VTLTFDEAVETSLGSLRVIDGTGALLAGTGPVVHPAGAAERVAIRLPHLPRGRYAVVWRVVSADSHIVDGAYAFGVGVPAGEPPSLERDSSAMLLVAVVHFALLASALLAIGLPLGALALGEARGGAVFVEFAAWFVVAVSAFADIAVRASLEGGTLGASFATRAGELRSFTMLAAVFGVSALVGGRRNWYALVPASIMLTLSLSLLGHAADGTLPALGVAADALHLVAAATWIGVLGIAATRGPSVVLLRISPIASIAVAAIVVSGVVQTVRNVGAWPALLATTYGRAIDCKIGLLVLALVLAWSARRSLARGSFALRQRLSFELALLSVVVGVTAVLVDLPRPIDAAAPVPAAVAFSLRVRDVDVRITAIERTPRGWALHVVGRAPAGSSDALDGVDASVTETHAHAGPFSVHMRRSAGAGYDGEIALPFAGDWTAFVSARSGDFDEAHGTFALPEVPR
jgi:copper transport protein